MDDGVEELVVDDAIGTTDCIVLLIRLPPNRIHRVINPIIPCRILFKGLTSFRDIGKTTRHYFPF